MSITYRHAVRTCSYTVTQVHQRRFTQVLVYKASPSVTSLSRLILTDITSSSLVTLYRLHDASLDTLESKIALEETSVVDRLA